MLPSNKKKVDEAAVGKTNKVESYSTSLTWTCHHFWMSVSSKMRPNLIWWRKKHRKTPCHAALFNPPRCLFGVVWKQMQHILRVLSDYNQSQSTYQNWHNLQRCGIMLSNGIILWLDILYRKHSSYKWDDISTRNDIQHTVVHPTSALHNSGFPVFL